MHRFIAIFICILLHDTLAGSVPLNGIFVSNSEKTIEWISHNNKGFYSAVESAKPGEIKKMYGTLIHKWKNGKLTVVASKDWEVPIKTPFIEVTSNKWQWTPKGESTYTIVILSPDSYYVDGSSTHGMLREYFDRRKAEQGAAANP